MSPVIMVDSLRSMLHSVLTCRLYTMMTGDMHSVLTRATLDHRYRVSLPSAPYILCLDARYTLSLPSSPHIESADDP